MKLSAKTFLTAALLLLIAADSSPAQESFEVRRALRGYELTVRLEGCGDEGHACSGPARVEVFRKRGAAPFQVLSLPNVEVYRDTVEHNEVASPKARRLYAEEYSFVGGDFDFDGAEDLAVCNGREGGYGGPSYTVFLFDRRARKFVESKALSQLTESPYLGLFFADPKRRRLTARSKSGCCRHETEVYRVADGRPILSEKVTEEAAAGAAPGEWRVTLTTRRKVGGRWVVTTKRERRRQ